MLTGKDGDSDYELDDIGNQMAIDVQLNAEPNSMVNPETEAADFALPSLMNEDDGDPDIEGDLSDADSKNDDEKAESTIAEGAVKSEVPQTEPKTLIDVLREKLQTESETSRILWDLIDKKVSLGETEKVFEAGVAMILRAIQSTALYQSVPDFKQEWKGFPSTWRTTRARIESSLPCHVKIPVCENMCSIFYYELKEVRACPECGVVRPAQPALEMHWFPFRNRLERWFSDPVISRLLWAPWRPFRELNDEEKELMKGILTDTTDGLLWQRIMNNMAADGSNTRVRTQYKVITVSSIHDR